MSDTHRNMWIKMLIRRKQQKKTIALGNFQISTSHLGYDRRSSYYRVRIKMLIRWILKQLFFFQYPLIVWHSSFVDRCGKAGTKRTTRVLTPRSYATRFTPKWRVTPSVSCDNKLPAFGWLSHKRLLLRRKSPHVCQQGATCRHSILQRASSYCANNWNTNPTFKVTIWIVKGNNEHFFFNLLHTGFRDRLSICALP